MVRRIAALLLAMIAVGCVGALPARAGGPTSVLLSAPPRVVAFGYDDRQYADLQRLTDIAGTRAVAGDERHDVGKFVRATWLIHDMSVWRLDIIYPDAPGGPWIATSVSTDGSTMPDEPTWHTASDPVALLKLLSSLQLLRGEPSYGGPTAFGHAPEPSASATEPPVQAQTADTGIFTGWRWTIPGFLLGALVAVIAVRLIPKRRDWQLVDAE